MSTQKPAGQSSAKTDEDAQNAEATHNDIASVETIAKSSDDRRNAPDAIADPFDIKAFDHLLSDLMNATEKAETPTKRQRRIRTFKKRKHRHVEHLPEAKDDDLEQIMAENLASRLAPSGAGISNDAAPIEEILKAEDVGGDSGDESEKALVVTPLPAVAAAQWWPPHRATMFGALTLVGLSVGIAAGYRPDVSFAGLGSYLSLDRLGASSERAVADLPADDLAASLRQAKIGFNDDGEAVITATNNIDMTALDSLKGKTVNGGHVQMASLGNAPGATAAPQTPVRRIGKAEADKLIERGLSLMKIGQLSSARLMFKRAVDGGDPRGAKMMGQTYDPMVFRTIPVAGVAPDREKAEFWYERSETMPAVFEASAN